MSNEVKRDLEICEENREFICDCKPNYEGCQEEAPDMILQASSDQ